MNSASRIRQQLNYLRVLAKQRSTLACVKPLQTRRIQPDINCWLRISLSGLLLASTWITNIRPVQAQPVFCATPGIDGSQNTNIITNTYFPGAANSTAATGSTSLNVDSYNTSGANVVISPGDMVMVIQMQDATINSTNTSSYGSGSTGGAGTGQVSLGNTGKYEFVRATNTVPLSGGTFTFEAGGTSGGLVNTYVSADKTATQGRRTFQIIRVPQYSTLTLASNISVPDWDGRSGGVLALDVAGDFNFNGRVIDGTAKGFRGGFQPSAGSGPNIPNYVFSSSGSLGGGKGEGIAGTPRYMWDGITAIDLGSDQLPGGDSGRGAPGNAGGGGNDHNSGGGGGANGGAGGLGGIGWEGSGFTAPANNTTNTPGGRGAAVPIPPTTDRLIMGGGGGGGDANNQPNGVRGGQGGGIVFIRADRFLGTGTIVNNGSAGEKGGFLSAPDGAGGGGAGGTVALLAKSGNLAGVTVEAKGGSGGNTIQDANNEHGPGGGGGGGMLLSYSPGGQISSYDLSGGVSGRAADGAGTPHGATPGATGQVGAIIPASVPPIQQGADCFPELNITKTEANPGTPGQRLSPGTATYTMTVRNTGDGGATGVRLLDVLPAGFTYSSGASATLSGGATGPVSPANLGTAAAPEFGDYTIPSGGSVAVEFSVVIAAGTTPGTYQNPAYVSYLDPTRTSANATRRISSSTGALPSANVTYESGGLAGQNVPGTNYNFTDSNGEDVVVLYSGPNVLLVKRITSINGQTDTRSGDNLTVYEDEVSNPYDDNVVTVATRANLTDPPEDTDKWPDPITFLLGRLDGGTIEPDDELEYTIYFLSTGISDANNVLFCDRVPENVTFIPTAYSVGAPLGTQYGIQVNQGGSITNLTGTQDTDIGQFFPSGVEPSTVFPDINCGGSNTNGAVVVNLGNLPKATAPATPGGAYGFVRFKGKVK